MHQRIAIITGASSGLGREYARLLLQTGNLDEVWAIARHKDKLERLRAELGNKIRPISADLSSQEAVSALEELLKRETPRVRWLINNAGYAKFGASSDLSRGQAVNMIHLNCSAVVTVTLACLPYLTHGGNILNIASQAAFQPLPYLNLYAATKAFVRSFSRALNVELQGKGIAVTAVCPGWMDTAFFERAEVGARRAPTNYLGIVTPDKVARQSLRDAARGRDSSVYGVTVKSAHLFAKLLPQRVMMKAWLLLQHL